MPRADEMISPDDETNFNTRLSVDVARDSIADELTATRRHYEDSIRTGDTANAAAALRYMAALNFQAQSLGVPQDNGLTAREQEWLSRRPSISQNPQKAAETYRVAQQLHAAGYERDSQAFFDALSQRVDPRPGDTEVPSPDDVVKMMQGSKYADKTPEGLAKAADSYNQGVHLLQRLKAAGNYRE